MTEVEICGGGQRTRLKSTCVSMGCPLPVYKGVEEGEGRHPRERPKGGFLLLVGVGFPLSLVGVGEEGRGRGREGKGGQPPSQFGLGLGGGCPHLGLLLLSPTKAQ